MGYFGSKATSGLCQALIALMPPHSVYIESHLGGGALMKRKPTGVRSIGIDRDAQALEAFACDYLSLPFIPSCLPTTARLSGTDIILSQWIL